MRKKKNPHFGSTIESWLDEEGIREEVTAVAQSVAVDGLVLAIVNAPYKRTIDAPTLRMQNATTVWFTWPRFSPMFRPTLSSGLLIGMAFPRLALPKPITL